MTGLHENSKDQLAEADVHWVNVVNLLPSRPPSFSPSFRTRRAILNPRSAIVAVNVDFCPVPATNIVEQAPSTLLPRRASIMNSKRRASASDRDGKHCLYLCNTGLHSSQKAYQGRQNWPLLHNQETDSSQTWQLSCEGLYASIEWSIEFL